QAGSPQPLPYDIRLSALRLYPPGLGVWKRGGCLGWIGGVCVCALFFIFFFEVGRPVGIFFLFIRA
ncbi:hypothetical protein ACPTJP_30145, partial [Pseudomonas aeruginosa]|uniref:hypothetical protein n=1 Tax=Pseudomonas aeruginosa TaxID=287 RepID=UPI003CC5F25F